MKGLLSLALLLKSPCVAAVLVDTTTISVELSTASYVAPASTTTTKAALLVELYRTRYERDRYRKLWLECLVIDLNVKDDLKACRDENASLWKAIKSVTVVK